jgi:hypothetical protein
VSTKSLTGTIYLLFDVGKRTSGVSCVNGRGMSSSARIVLLEGVCHWRGNIRHGGCQEQRIGRGGKSSRRCWRGGGWVASIAPTYSIRYYAPFFDQSASCNLQSSGNQTLKQDLANHYIVSLPSCQQVIMHEFPPVGEHPFLGAAVSSLLQS